MCKSAKHCLSIEKGIKKSPSVRVAMRVAYEIEEAFAQTASQSDMPQLRIASAAIKAAHTKGRIHSSLALLRMDCMVRPSSSCKRIWRSSFSVWNNAANSFGTSSSIENVCELCRICVAYWYRAVVLKS